MRPDDAVGAEVERLLGEDLFFSPPFGGMRMIGVTDGATEPEFAIWPRFEQVLQTVPEGLDVLGVVLALEDDAVVLGRAEADRGLDVGVRECAESRLPSRGSGSRR